MIDNQERQYILERVARILEVIGPGNSGKKERIIKRMAKDLEELVK